MHKKLFILLLWLFTGSRVFAQQEPVNTGSILDIYNHLSSVLTRAQSIDFDGTYQAVDTEIAAPMRGLPVGTPLSGINTEVHFRGRGDKYLCTAHYVKSSGEDIGFEDKAWDGKYYQELTHRDNYLLITQRNPGHNFLQLPIYNALNMFHFLMGELPPGDPTISWDLVKNMAAWKTCLASARLVGPVRFHDKPCSAVTISNVSHRRPDVPRCTYTVYFSWNDGMFPLAWKIEDEYHRVLEDYEVEEFGQASVGDGYVFYYPKKVKGADYPFRDFPPSKPWVTYTADFNVFNLNTITDDKLFTIDRTKVTQIYDYDWGVCTPVRK